MRRRAASYNIKRLPVRLRQKAIEEAAKDPEAAPKKIKKPPCRRRRRRPKDIQQEFANRQHNIRWLETHLWHAKRTRMQNLWGYRIAVKVNEKCLKSCLRATQKGCFLYDLSYYEMIVIDSREAAQLHKLGSALRLEITADSNPSTGFVIICNEKSELVGPAILIFENRVARLLVHPFMTAAVANLLGVEDHSILRLKYSAFQLEGTRAIDIIRQVTFDQVDNHNDFYFGTAQDPRFGAPGELSSTEPISLWDVEANAQAVVRRRPEKELNKVRSQLAIAGTKIVPSSSDPSMPFGLFKIAQPHSWLLIVPIGWGTILWRTMIKCKVRFGGLTEKNFIERELGRPCFPEDYASSTLFQAHNTVSAADLEAQWKGKPPAKRINYEILGINSPFRIHFDAQLFQLCMCRIEVFGRGVPEYNARVFLRSELIGFVTTGYYSQRLGRGVAYATLKLPYFDESMEVKVQNLVGPERQAHVVKIYHHFIK